MMESQVQSYVNFNSLENENKQIVLVNGVYLNDRPMKQLDSYATQPLSSAISEQSISPSSKMDGSSQHEMSLKQNNLLVSNEINRSRSSSQPNLKQLRMHNASISGAHSAQNRPLPQPNQNQSENILTEEVYLELDNTSTLLRPTELQIKSSTTGTDSHYETQTSRKLTYAFGAISFVSIIFGAIAIAIASHSLSVFQEALDNRFPNPSALLQTQTEKPTEAFMTVKESRDIVMSINESIEKIMKLNTTLQLLLKQSNSTDLDFNLTENLTKILRRGYLKLDDGWIAPFNGYQYKFNHDTLTWNESRATCQSWGGDLIVYGFRYFSTRLIITRAFGISTYWSWIGLRDVSNQNQWTWVNGHRARSDDFTIWRRGEPSPDFVEDCAAVVSRADHPHEYLANDVRCSDTFVSICEKISDWEMSLELSGV